MRTNPYTGSWLRNALKSRFPYKKDLELAAMIGISPQAFANWGRNDGVSRLPNAETLYLGYKALGLINEEAMTPAGSTAPARVGEWPVRGLASSDIATGSRMPNIDEGGEIVSCPSGIVLVPVKGDSMAPLVAAGQYVIIDRDREGFETNGGIVVASILDSDWERRERMPGTFVKRCFCGDGFYYFTSIDSACPPFSSWQDHCKIWPVLGVWFGKPGRPPRN